MQAADSLDRMLDGPTSVRDRDMRMNGLRRTVERPQQNTQYRLWKTQSRPGPSNNFKPHGSFAPLMGGGKISNGMEGQARQQQGRHHIPGYTGYIKGNQHISGRRFSEVTRRSYTRDLVNLCTEEGIPADPQNNMKIPHAALEDRFMYGVTENKAYNVPGYTGHVPAVREIYAQTFGKTTRNGWAKHHESFPNNPQEREGYAYTLHERKANHIASDPLPGSCGVQKPPQFCIPPHIDHLKFFPI